MDASIHKVLAAVQEEFPRSRSSSSDGRARAAAGAGGDSNRNSSDLTTNKSPPPPSTEPASSSTSPARARPIPLVTGGAPVTENAGPSSASRSGGGSSYGNIDPSYMDMSINSSSSRPSLVDPSSPTSSSYYTTMTSTSPLDLDILGHRDMRQQSTSPRPNFIELPKSSAYAMSNMYTRPPPPPNAPANRASNDARSNTGSAFSSGSTASFSSSSFSSAASASSESFSPSSVGSTFSASYPNLISPAAGSTPGDRIQDDDLPKSQAPLSHGSPHHHHHQQQSNKMHDHILLTPAKDDLPFNFTRIQPDLQQQRDVAII